MGTSFRFGEQNALTWTWAVVSRCLLLMTLVLTLACNPTVEGLPEAAVSGFNGIDRIEPAKGGRWRLIWRPVTDVSTAEYLIFERDETSGNFDFQSPLSRTEETFFITSDLRLHDSRCYVVRALIDGDVVNLNDNELCTGHLSFAFRGIRDIQPLEKGNYLLSWPLAPYSKRELSYEVRERRRGQKVWAVSGTTAENFFPTRVVNIEEVVCFNVRYIHSSLPKDLNEKEICTDEENTGNFTGIKEIVKADDALGGYILHWERSIRNDVIGYRIFKGLQMSELIAEVGSDKTSHRITGLGIGATYEFGVRLVTRSGREDGNKKVLRVTVENDIPVVTSATLEPVTPAAGAEITQLLCESNFVDPDLSHKKIYPRIAFKAEITSGERPIIERETIIGDPVDLNADGAGTFSALYTLDPSKDRRGSDLFCEVTVFDGIDPSTPYRSNFHYLPDTAPVATGMFISKKVYFDTNSGTTHYYDDEVGGGAGQSITKFVNDEVVVENHACMMAGPEGAVQNPNTLDICEDTSLELLVKKVVIPTELLEPGREFEKEAFQSNIPYAEGSLGTDYEAFYADSANRAKLGYFDPDDADLASQIEVRDPKNGTVGSSRCLEGVCTINFSLAKDYNSGSDLGDKKSDGTPYEHAQLEYRVRTFEPTEDHCAGISQEVCDGLGWSNWAPLKVEVTAVDEEPRITGITVSAVEDTVQKVVFCNQRRNDPTYVTSSEVDPECAQDKTITLNPAFDPTTQDESFKYLSGQGFGYYDLEDDPMVRVLPDAQVPSALGEWVIPKQSNPDPSDYSHWEAVTTVPLTAADSCDQTATNPVTGEATYCPFHCNKEQSKCWGYFKPAVDAHGSIELGYDLWVEVDENANPDPSFAGLSGKDREVKASQPGKIFLEIEKVNDPADLAAILEPNWYEDEHDGTPHQINFKRVTSYLANSVAGAIYVPYYDPDIFKDDNGITVLDRSDMLRRATDVEVRFFEGGEYKYSYCDIAGLTRSNPNDYPGNLVSSPNICELETGPVSYNPLPPSDDAGTFIDYRSKMTLNCYGNGDCDGTMDYPPNYHGTHNFEYRILTTSYDADGLLEIETDDWSPWKSVELRTSPVGDAPQVFTLSLGGQDSLRANIREDVNFIVKLVKGKGVGGYNIVIDGADVPEQRYYEGYFDVDETDDIAHTVIVTALAEFQAGSPVLLDKDGNAILGDDSLVLNSSATGNSTLFSCDSNGLCEAEFRSAENFFVPDGQPDPYFEFLVLTHPKSIADRAEPDAFKPSRDQSSDPSLPGKVSFNVAPVDDAPGLAGSGGLALPEDTPTVFIVGKNPGTNEIGYTEIEDSNVAEKIEIANIVYYDPVIQAVIEDQDSVASSIYGYPDGLANNSGTTGPNIFPPAAIDRTGTPISDRLLIRGERFASAGGTNPFKVADGDVDNYKLPPDAGQGLPERWQFSCRRSADAELSPGECWIEVRSPLHFNTGSGVTSGSDPRPDALRVASFDYRIFTRDPALWKEPGDVEDDGAWSEFVTIALSFDPVNDRPEFQGTLDLVTLSSDGQTGNMSAANPWEIAEDTEEYLTFSWGEHYIDPDYSTESYTYREDISLWDFGAFPQFIASGMRYSSRFLATKIALFEVEARTSLFGQQAVADKDSWPECPFTFKHRTFSLPDECQVEDELESFTNDLPTDSTPEDNPNVLFPVRSYLASAERTTSLVNVNDEYTLAHNLDLGSDVNGGAGNITDWDVYDESNGGALLTEIERDSNFSIVLGSSDNNNTVIRRTGGTFGPNLRFRLVFPTRWVQSHEGEFHGVPAPDNLVTAKSNINCDENGDCRVYVDTHSNFVGTVTANMRLADGSSAPKEKDWTPDSLKRNIHISVEPVDDLPVMGEDVALDLLEDRTHKFVFWMKSNAALKAPDSKGAQYAGYGSGTWMMSCGCDCNNFPAIPYHDLTERGTWTYPSSFTHEVQGDQCFYDAPSGGVACTQCETYRGIAMFHDNDRERPRFFDFLAPMPDAARIVLRDPGNGGRESSGNTDHTAPFLWTVAERHGQEYFQIVQTPNYFNAIYREGATTGRPYDYVHGADQHNAGATRDGFGDLYYDFRVKTNSRDASFTNTIDCSDPANCWSDVGRIYVRIHPVDDPAQFQNTIATTVNGVNVNVFDIITGVKEDSNFTIDVDPSQYIDIDHNDGLNEGLAVGITSCLSSTEGLNDGEVADTPFFTFAEEFRYEIEREDVFKGSQDDPLSDVASLLRLDEMEKGKPASTVSTGRLVFDGGAPKEVAEPLHETLFRSGSLSAGGISDPSLSASCTYDAGSQTPTGTCSLEVKPDANIFGEFLLCVQIATMPGKGDRIDPYRYWSDRGWVKVVIDNLDDPPHIGQLAVRARGNEDHFIDVEVGPTKFEFQRQAEKMGPADANSVLRPAYWDLDSPMDGPTDDNHAEFMFIDMNSQTGVFTGIAAGKIYYRPDPSTDRTNMANYTNVCSFGMNPSNICKIPCESDGQCFFKFEPPDDEPRSVGGGEYSMKWWVSSKGGAKLSSRQVDNLWVNRNSGGLPDVGLTTATGAVEADYVAVEANNNYELSTDFQCLDKTYYDIDRWRLKNAEEDAYADSGGALGIPGVYGGEAFSPISTPVYSVARPAEQIPNPARVIPSLSLLDDTQELRLFRVGGVSTNDTVTLSDTVCTVDGTRDGIPYCEPADFNVPSQDDCGRQETGRLMITVEPVQDKPVGRDVTRVVSGSHPTYITLSSSLTAGVDGYLDGDGDKPSKLRFLDPSQLTSAMGTISLSATPPAPGAHVGLAGSGMILDDNGTPGNASDDTYYVPQEATIPQPGCSLNEGDCSFYFHPKPGFNGTVVLDFAVSTIGSDSYEWESDRVGPDGPGTLTFDVRSDLPTISLIGAEPYEVSEDASAGVVKISGGSANVSLTIDEGGGAEQDQDEVVVSFLSSDVTIVDPSKITFSRTDQSSGIAYDMGAAAGQLTITPEPDRFTTTPITITVKATEVLSGLESTQTFQLSVLPQPDAPTIGVDPNGTYAINEGSSLVVNGVEVDEGGGNDENGEELVVTFSSSDATIIDPATDITFDMSDEAVSGNDAGGSGRTLTITPKTDAYAPGGVTITMNVDDQDGVTPVTQRAFTVNINPVNDAPVKTSAAPTVGPYVAATDTSLVISGITLDEGGATDGVGNENDQTLTVAFTTSDPAAIALGDIALTGTNDNGALDSNALTKTLTITPSGQGQDVTVTLRISDDGGSSWVDYPFEVDVREPPRGPLSCTAGGGAGSNEHIVGVGQPISGITCSGLTASVSAVDGSQAANYEVSAQAESTCSGGITIHPTTGVISGNMDATDCDVMISGDDTSAHNTKVPPSERTLVKFLAADVSSVVLSNVSIDNTCSLSLDVTTTYYMGRSSFQSATPGGTSGAFGGFSANDSSFSANLVDFSQSSDTLTLSITDNKGTSDSGNAVVTISESNVATLKATEPAATLAGISAEGVQATFDNSAVCVDETTCLAEEKALIAVGGDHVCSLEGGTATDKLHCWGDNDSAGKVGIGVTTASSTYTSPQDAHAVTASMTNLRAIAAGQNHTCVIDSANSLKCFGLNSSGQLGVADATYADKAVPTATTTSSGGSPNPVSVAAGQTHTCYLGDDGKAYCAGLNSAEQLGYDTTSDADTDSTTQSHTFQESAGVTGAVSIAAGNNHTCVLTGAAGSREVKCWGSNSHNQLGILGLSTASNSSFAAAADVVAAATLNDAVGVFAGGNSTCVVLDSGAVHCWGDNSKGQLGDNSIVSTDGHLGTPTKAATSPTGLSNVVTMAMGDEHGCAITTSQELYCFGEGDQGRLALGSTADALVPTKVSSPATGIVAVSAGQGNTCFVTQDDQVFCAGKGSLGALGNGATADESTAQGIGSYTPVRRSCQQYGVSL